MKEVFLSVVIPCYDEITNLQKGVLTQVHNFLQKKKQPFEIIVADDGSKDGSVEFVSKLAKEYPQIKLLQNHHMGKAGAVTSGVLSATGEYVLFTDMDQATPIEEVDKLLPFVTDKNFDIAIGSRTTGDLGYPFSRFIVHEGMIVVRKLVVGLFAISDTQCGFKLFTQEAAHSLFTKMNKIHNGFSQIAGSAVTAGFDVELLFLAKKMKYRIKEVPVKWKFVETRRVNPIKDSIDALAYLLKIRLNQITGKY
ncbi:MAG TPA: glycosyltransferase [Patescibacteria group bacterium]